MTRFLKSVMYNVSTTDPLVYRVMGIFVLFVALLAAYVPGKRAARVDPVIAVKSSYFPATRLLTETSEKHDSRFRQRESV